MSSSLSTRAMGLIEALVGRRALWRLGRLIYRHARREGANDPEINGEYALHLRVASWASGRSEPFNVIDVADQASVLRWPGRGVKAALTASSELRHLVVFTPPGEDYFCVEPTSHAPDAVNSSLSAELTGYRELQPGETLSAEISLSVEVAA